MRYAFLATILLASAFASHGVRAAESSQRSATEIPAVATPAGLAGIYYVLDCTNEGYINPGEVTEHGGVLYRRMDLDRSGKVSRAEYVGFVNEKWRPIRENYFDQMDKNGDDVITVIDYMAHLSALVDEADLNRDGDAAWSEILTLRNENPDADDHDDHHHSGDDHDHDHDLDSTGK